MELIPENRDWTLQILSIEDVLENKEGSVVSEKLGGPSSQASV